MDLYIKNATAYIGGTFVKTDITINNGKIASLKPNPANSLPVHDVSGNKVLPGFIDIHTHGAYNVDVNNATSQDLCEVSKYFASQGTTSYLTSIVTDTEEKTLQCIEQIINAMKMPTCGAKILGIHLEGPFLDPEYRGSMAIHLLKKANNELFEKYFNAAEGNIRYITISPEVEGAMDLIKEAVKKGVVVSIGHSGADYETAMESIEIGATSSTHTFNGMKLMHQHFPAIAGAVLESNIFCEAICDGRHLHPAVVRLLIKTKGLDRVVAVTDSIMATGLPDGEYILGVNKVRVTDGDARLISDGTRAGSTLTTITALKNLIKFTGRKMEELIPLLTSNPAALMRISDKKGSIEEGKDADLVVIDDELNVETTIVGGNIIFNKNN
ncbi:MAG: N-acetylglucosamine-6-phosphate deacetylase [Clostridiaceae bacterium]|nr:N-acetylglucosamine-6-phosphate deacetylase [Clostridiaceae bacterium]